MTPLEREFAANLELQGWTISRKGFPDFVCQREDEVKLIEVKQGLDPLRENQIKTFKALESIGLSIEVVRILGRGISPIIEAIDGTVKAAICKVKNQEIRLPKVVRQTNGIEDGDLVVVTVRKVEKA